MTTLKHFSQAEVESFKYPFKRVRLISITSPDARLARIDEDLFEDVLRLQFYDTDRKIHNERFTREHAKKILDFVEGAESVYVHCLLGQSRSVGVVRALADIYDVDVNTPQTYNSLVHRIILNEHHDLSDNRFEFIFQ